MPGSPTVLQLLNQILAAVQSPPDNGLGAKVEALQKSVDALTADVQSFMAQMGFSPNPPLSPEDQRALDSIASESKGIADQSAQISQQTQQPQ